MNLPHSLSFVIQRSHSLSEILQTTVQLVAERMGTDVCSIYLVDHQRGEIVLAATHGLDAKAVGSVSMGLGEGITGTVVREMRWISVEDASLHPRYRYFPETGEERYQSYLGVPLALRNRPSGAIVVQTRDRRTFSNDERETLTTIAAQLVGVVENARLINALDTGDEGMRYIREFRTWHSTGANLWPENRADAVLEGSAAAPGLAIGEALLRGSHELTSSELSDEFRGAEEELGRLDGAIDRTRSEILLIQEAAEREADEEHALIFSSHLLLLNDAVLLDLVTAAIRSGTPATRAVYEALQQFGAKLQGVDDPYIRERAEDIWDLRTRLLIHLRNERSPASSLREKIVVTQSIAPSLVVELKAHGARGIITERGGPTSHGALLARSMGVPAVTGIPNVVSLIRSGQRVVIDGFDGRVLLAPSDETIRVYEERLHELNSRRVSHMSLCHLPARTRDRLHVQLQANIAVIADLALAKENGAEGVGLYRTEFPFIIREDFPTREEQVRIYRRAWEYFPEGPIRFRLLDLGGDKVLPSARVASDRNPFSGYRSLRVLLDNPTVLRDQAQAIVLAADGRPVEVLIPMVSALGELLDTLEHIRAAITDLGPAGKSAQVQVGTMVELPGAVEIAHKLAKHVSFFSIGSNDLVQYALAADREDARSANHANPCHPAILAMIRRTIEAARGAGIPVSVCGAAVANRRCVLALLALGLESLSIEPASIPELKAFLTQVRIGPLRASIDAILDLEDTRDIETALDRYMPRPERSQKVES